MTSTDSNHPLYQPWVPMNDPTDVKHLGKLGEETGELSAAISRCLIQGIDAKEPVTGKVNKQWLEEEIADVMVNLELCVVHFRLNSDFIVDRIEEKRPKLEWWHKQATGVAT